MPAAHHQPPLLLVIEDEADVRALFQERLEALGVRVVVAVDGADGLQQLERWRPDAVLCDLAMPVMDGVTFAARMRAACQGTPR
jgi:CheY-like chemotaxis protein